MHVDGLVQPIDAQLVVCWFPPHEVRDEDKVQAIAASMDSDPDRWVWAGVPLVADVDAGQLWTGTHRQAALLHHGHEVVGWGVPVVDLWDLIDRAIIDGRCEDGEDWDDAILAGMAATVPSEVLDQIGWDRD